MNKISLITSLSGIALALATAAPAFAHADDSVSADASVNVSASTGEDHGVRGLLPKFREGATTTVRAEHASSTGDRMEKMGEKAGNAIDARIKSLQDLETRLSKMKLLSADMIASIKVTLDAEIQQLVDLKAKIGADTSKDDLKGDVESITKGNRVYLLVEPKARIAAAASRINAVVTQFTALGTKLAARISEAQSAGVDVSAAVSAKTDFDAKIADAKTQADAAVSETANLAVDNGDKTVLQANIAALKDARTKLGVAQQDLIAARKDAMTIAGVVKGHVSASATTTP